VGRAAQARRTRNWRAGRQGPVPYSGSGARHGRYTEIMTKGIGWPPAHARAAGAAGSVGVRPMLTIPLLEDDYPTVAIAAVRVARGCLGAAPQSGIRLAPPVLGECTVVAGGQTGAPGFTTWRACCCTSPIRGWCTGSAWRWRGCAALPSGGGFFAIGRSPGSGDVVFGHQRTAAISYLEWARSGAGSGRQLEAATGRCGLFALALGRKSRQ